ncbi:hypothetical protein L226DRAFT_561225 [Lentinus tigrinus ALCF2SS1-7]|uniref:Mid2 domain-containing protein n=1 Tax=Lentinus tigrinus ALCF2SS1-6 TaxID=1328759 RepID=A0A5C2S7X7_9APHY|nr:hypothetical protein L227DRAFT_586745 [Lentinus tigrinus ALCF2SS1-6]RPD73509.1 hypothetical protein L226DRAFT_561225 [Lentinus tigrinus ALCF2SS1-7]
MRTPPAVLAFAALLYLAVPAFAKHGEGEDGTSDAHSASQSSSPSASSSSTSSASSPSPSGASIQFLQPSNATTCQDVMIRWQSTNLNVPITLTVTNDRATASPGVNDNVLISRTLATNLSASANQYMWLDVDVPQGLYVAVAFDTSHTAGVFSQSLPFFVQTGQDSSCLSTGTSSSSSPTSSSNSTRSGVPSPTPTSGASAESDTAQPKKLSPAVLGGVVAGVIVGVILLILVFTFPHYWKEFRLKRARARRPGGPYYLF